MTSLAIDGVTIERIVKKFRFDISELQRKADEAQGLEFDDELLAGIVTKVIALLDSKKTYASEEDNNRQHLATNAQLNELSKSTEQKFLDLENKMRNEYTEKMDIMKKSYDRYEVLSYQ
jgi:hypothetical protein